MDESPNILGERSLAKTQFILNGACTQNSTVCKLIHTGTKDLWWRVEVGRDYKGARENFNG